MARVLPFRALLQSSAGPSPWDSQAPLSETQRRQLLADEGHGLHLAQAPDPRVALERWLDRGVLRREARPAFYIFEVQSPRPGEPPVRFVLGMVPPQEGLEPLEQGRRPTAAPLITPEVAVAADDHRALHELLEGIAPEAPVVFEGRLDDDQRWRLLREERSGPVRRLQALMEDAPLRPLGPLPEGSAQLMAVLPLSEPGWRFRSIHRAVKGLETFNAERFLQLVAGYARVLPLDVRLDTELGRAEARERLGTVSRGSHAVLLVLPGGRNHLLRFRQGLGLPSITAVPRSPTLRSLDLALLNSLVLRTVLGLQDPEDPGHANVFTVASIEALVRGVDEGLYQVGFALNPPPPWEVRAVMEAGDSLPPRTLRLEPWPPAGLIYGDPTS